VANAACPAARRSRSEIAGDTGNPLADAVADVPGPMGFAACTAVDVAERTGDAVTAARGFPDNLRR
jgi:hypothetical protein